MVERFLVLIPKNNFTGEVAGENEISISFEIRENLPNMDILSAMPVVEELDIQPESIMSC